MLARNQKVYRRRDMHLSYIDMQNLLPKMKSYLPWLKEVDSRAIKYSCRHLDTAFKKFFNHEAGFPNFHSKKGRQSYTTEHPTTIKVASNKVQLPKLGWLKVRGIRQIPENAKICYATVSKELNGKYCVSVTYKYEKIVAPKSINKALGLDYKSNGLYMDSNGNVANEPHWFCENQAKLCRLQRSLSRRKGSKRGEQKSRGWLKQRRKVARLQEHIANQRKDFLHKLSKELADFYDLIAVEDLNMNEVVHAFNYKSYHKRTYDNGYGMFTTMLDYKLKYQGKQLIRIDKNYPSSQVCSCCGNQNESLKDITIRKWECPKCHVRHDRDFNSAINIREEALRMLTVKTA